MIYRSGADYLKAPRKRIMLFGMSGLGKTYLSNLLRDHGDWFHYSVDYRIGTRYMGEFIADNFKREAMKVPLLRELLMTDSVYIASNITFDNLAPLSTYLGKPGDPAKGGVPFAEYMKRQEQHRQAEVAATLDTARFMERAEELYGYPNFVCDTSGSICEVVNAEDPADPVQHLVDGYSLIVRGIAAQEGLPLIDVRAAFAQALVAEPRIGPEYRIWVPVQDALALAGANGLTLLTLEEIAPALLALSPLDEVVSARVPLVMNAFSPVTTNWSPSRTAVVVSDARPVPASGSV